MEGETVRWPNKPLELRRGALTDMHIPRSREDTLAMERYGKGKEIDIRNRRKKEEAYSARTPGALFYEVFIQLRHLGLYGFPFQGRIIPLGQGLPRNIICVPRTPEKPSNGF